MVHNQRSTVTGRVRLVIGLVALWGAGCTSSPGPEEFCGLTGYSGFLNDYSRLEPSPTHKGAWYEQWTDLAEYHAFIVDPIQVLPEKTVDCRPIGRETATELGAMLRAEVVDALSLSGFRITAEPGPGVARIRGAITEVTRTKKGSGDSAAETHIGGASCEVEIADSASGKRLAAAVERDVGPSEFRKGEADPYFDAKVVFRHWAARLSMWMRGQQGDAR